MKNIILFASTLLLIACKTTVKTINTKNISELKSNQSIQLEEGDYVFDQGIQWKHLSNIEIIGRGKDKTRILVKESYDAVIKMDSCKNINLKNLSLGHKTESHCWGGVVHAENSQNITIENSILFGSGIEGLTLYKVDGLKLKNSQITECTQAIMTIVFSKNIEIEQAQIFKNGFQNEAQCYIFSSELRIDNSSFQQNLRQSSLFQIDHKAAIQARHFDNKTKPIPSALSIKNSTFQGGFYHRFNKIGISYIPHDIDILVNKKTLTTIENCNFDFKDISGKHDF